MNSDRKQENGNEGEVDDGMDKYGDTAGVEVGELDHPALARQLEDEPRGQQDEEDDRNEHGRPVRHL